MDITFCCIACGQRVEIDAAGAGLLVDCPNCHAKLRVPQGEPAPEGSPIAPNLMNCPDCGHLCSKRAASCPKCGAPIAPTLNPLPSSPGKVVTASSTDQNRKSRAPIPIPILVAIVFCVVAGSSWGIYGYHQAQVKKARVSAEKARIILEEKRAREASRREMRVQLTELVFSLKKGLMKMDFDSMSRAVLVAAQIHRNDLDQEEIVLFKDLEADVDACAYFWSRSISPANIDNCLEVNQDDLSWLKKAGLESNNDVWRAFDFKSSRAAFLAGRESAYAVVLSDLAGDNASDRLDAREQAHKRALQDSLEFMKEQKEKIPAILDEAAKKRDRYDPDFALEKTMGSVGKASEKLISKLAPGGDH